MPTVPDLQPDELDALQAETDGPEPSVKVSVDGPVRTQDLPRKQAASRTRIATTTPLKYLAADHRRASAKVVSFDQDMLIAFNVASAGDPSTMSRWPKGVQYTLTADSELWVASITATSTISITTEFWATGE